MSGLTFEVRDVPAPQGSKRHVGHGILVESSKKVKPWREAVRSECVAAMRDTAISWPTGPIAVIIRFSLPRPKSHYRTGRNAGVLRDDAPGYCSKRPDVDKLVRSTLDALTAAGLYGDDAQVAVLEVEKRYADPDPVGAVITVSAL
jgi:Holliday junction resolvase RusA-like endonuclease